MVLSKEMSMDIHAFTSLVGETPRQIRFLIAEGFIPPPRGGRATAEYGDDHAAAIRRYQRLREQGIAPAGIRALLQAGEATPFPVVPGITLLVDPSLLGSGAQAGPALARLALLLPDILRKDAT